MVVKFQQNTSIVQNCNFRFICCNIKVSV